MIWRNFSRDLRQTAPRMISVVLITMIAVMVYTGLNGVLYNADQIIGILGLPKLVVPIVTLTVGYPAEPLPDQPERLPLAAIVHEERYTDYTPEAIDTLYADKEALEVNRQFVRENNKKTLAQVFTDIRYTKANNEHFSEVLLRTLREQGFMGKL